MGQRKDQSTLSIHFVPTIETRKPLQPGQGRTHYDAATRYFVKDPDQFYLRAFTVSLNDTPLYGAILDCAQKPVLLLQFTLIFSHPCWHKILAQLLLLMAPLSLPERSCPDSGEGRKINLKYKIKKIAAVVWCTSTVMLSHPSVRAWGLFPGGPVKQWQTSEQVLFPPLTSLCSIPPHSTENP